MIIPRGDNSGEEVDEAAVDLIQVGDLRISLVQEGRVVISHLPRHLEKLTLQADLQQVELALTNLLHIAPKLPLTESRLTVPKEPLQLTTRRQLPEQQQSTETEDIIIPTSVVVEPTLAFTLTTFPLTTTTHMATTLITTQESTTTDMATTFTPGDMDTTKTTLTEDEAVLLVASLEESLYFCVAFCAVSGTVDTRHLILKSMSRRRKKKLWKRSPLRFITSKCLKPMLWANLHRFKLASINNMVNNLCMANNQCSTSSNPCKWDNTHQCSNQPIDFLTE
jgi:hypothetical protein